MREAASRRRGCDRRADRAHAGLAAIPARSRRGSTRSTPWRTRLRSSRRWGRSFRTRWPVLTLGVVTAATVTYLLLAYPYGPVMVCRGGCGLLLGPKPSTPTRPAVRARRRWRCCCVHVFTHPAALPPAGRADPRERHRGGAVHRRRSRAGRWPPRTHGSGASPTSACRRRAAAAGPGGARRRRARSRRDPDAGRHHVAPADPRPEQTRAALEAISEASAAALDELRATLAAIHQAGDEPRDAGADARSGRADRLCRRVRGLRRRGPSLDVDGHPRAAATGGRRGRLPGAPGVADQRGQALRPPARRRERGVRLRTPSSARRSRNQNLGRGPGRRQSGSPGCAAGSTRLGGTFRAGPGRRRYVPGARHHLPPGGRVTHDLGAARRRPGPGPDGPAHAVRQRGRVHRRRGGRRRAGRRRSEAGPLAARRGADGHPHARASTASRRPAASPPTPTSPARGSSC